MSRPDRISFAGFVAYPKRGPTNTDPRWYWQCGKYDKGFQTFESGRMTQEEVLVTLQRAAAASITGAEKGTVGEILLSWLGEQKARRDLGAIHATSYGGYWYAVNSFSQQGFWNWSPKVIRAREEEVVLQMQSIVADTTALVRLGVLRAALLWEARRVRADWDVPRFRFEVEHVNNMFVPTHQQIQSVISLMSGWAKSLTQVALLTGARKGELNSLRCMDIDSQGSRLNLHRKGKKKRSWVPVHPIAIDVLRPMLLGRSPKLRVWPVSKASVKNGWGKHLSRACAAASVPVFTPHSIRRLVSTLLIEKGTNPAVYEMLMGHSYEMGYRTYARVRGEAVQSALGHLAASAFEER